MRYVFSLLVACLVLSLIPDARAATAVSISDTVLAPKSSFGVNVGSASANIIDGGCFEAAADSNGFASQGWGWYKGTGTFTASVDTGTFVSGKQSQKIEVFSAPAEMKQTQVDLPQQALTRQMTPNGSYIIKARVKSDSGSAHIQFGFVDGSWTTHYSADIAVTTAWATYSFTFTPTTTDLLRGVSIKFVDNATYWIDDVASWNANEIDPSTGFIKTYVDRLKELKPGMLRLGGLGVNGIPLENYLFKSWPLSYGPPPNEYYNINTFMTLCKVTGANAFICMPPAFTDTASAATQTDLTVDLVNNHYADHGNMVDYLGGENTTVYGARRTTDGFTRWDLQLGAIYFEMGNETWGTPDGKWDMHLGLAGDPWVQTYATYCSKRMTEMKGRPGWRSNMRVGFGGFAADTDNWANYSTNLIPALKSLADFGTVFMYYGSGSNANSNEDIYGGLFAKAQWHERELGRMNTKYAAAAGHSVECCVYEGNCVWGNYYNGPSANDQFVYSKEVSAGAAVSLLDNYAAGNRAGVTYNNHFAFTGGAWSSLTDQPNYFRKPAYYALKMFNSNVSGNMLASTISGATTWSDTLTGEVNVPYVACYPYKDGINYNILLINRDRTSSQSVTINRAMTVTQLVVLSSATIDDNNESGETVTLQTQSITGTGNSYTLKMPPFSAIILKGHDIVNNLPPAVTLTAPTATTFNAGANIALAATAADSDGTVTKVDFYAGTTLLGSDTTSPYTFTWNNVLPGSYALTAVATDNTGLTTTSSVINIVVKSVTNIPPTVMLVAPANNAVYTVGASIALTATAADTDGQIVQIEFYAGNTLLNTQTASPYSFLWNNATAGTYMLTAVATDNGGLTATSLSVNIVVNPSTPNVPPMVALTAPANNTAFSVGDAIMLQATAADSDGSVRTVEFYAGTVLIGTSTASPYSFVWNNAAAGSYVLTAVATDDKEFATASAGINIVVNASQPVPEPGSTPAHPAPTIGSAAAPSQSPAIAGQPVTFSVGASSADGSPLIYVWDFGDGTTITVTSATVTHVYATAGDFTATVSITETGGAPASSSTSVSVIAGTIEMQVSKLNGRVKFSSPGHDICLIAGSLPGLPPDIKPAGQTVVVNAGGAQVTFKLDTKGKARNANGTFAFKLPSGKKSFQGGALAYQASLKGNFAAAWAAHGMDPAKTQDKLHIDIPATLQFGGVTYIAATAVVYSAKAHVGGKFAQ